MRRTTRSPPAVRPDRPTPRCPTSGTRSRRPSTPTTARSRCTPSTRPTPCSRRGRACSPGWSNPTPLSPRAFGRTSGTRRTVRGAAFPAGALPRRRPGELLPELRVLEAAERSDGERGGAGSAAPVLPAGHAARVAGTAVRADQCAHRVPARIHERLPCGVLRPGQLRETHRAAITHLHPDTRPQPGPTTVPDDAGDQQPGDVVHPAGRLQGDLREPADPAGERRAALRRTVLHPGPGVLDIVPAAEPGAGLVRRSGRGRADPPAGADQGGAERPGADPGRRRRGRGDGYRTGNTDHHHHPT